MPAGMRGRGGTVALHRSEPPVHPVRHAVGRAKELPEPVDAELPCEVPQPEHVLEELFHGGPPWRVVAGNCSTLRLRRLGHQPGTESLPPLGAGRAPRGDPQRLAPRQEVLGRFLDRLAVVGPEEPRLGAAHVQVHRGLFPAPAEEAWLWEDSDAGEPLLPDAEPALHRCMEVPCLQSPLVGGRRGEVPVVDVGRGMSRAQGCVPSMLRPVSESCLLDQHANRPHGWGAVVPGGHHCRPR